MPTLLVASDADWIQEEVVAALAGPDTTIAQVRRGKDVRLAVAQLEPVLTVLDLQIGSMGGVAACLDLRLEESGGRLPHTAVLMLLDREADVFLARRSGADGWLIKPLDAFRLRRAASALLEGGTYTEGVPEDAAPAPGVPAS